MAPRDFVRVGVIMGAHGVRGEVKLKSFTSKPSEIASYNPLETKAGDRIEIAKLRAQKDGFIAFLQGVADRDAAEALKGMELFVPRERLPEPKDGEVYLGDLVGHDVWAGGKLLGKIEGVVNYGAGDLLDVKIESRKDTILIPFGFVTGVTAEKITVELPDGFLDSE